MARKETVAKARAPLGTMAKVVTLVSTAPAGSRVYRAAAAVVAWREAAVVGVATSVEVAAGVSIACHGNAYETHLHTNWKFSGHGNIEINATSTCRHLCNDLHAVAGSRVLAAEQ